MRNSATRKWILATLVLLTSSVGRGEATAGIIFDNTSVPPDTVSIASGFGLGTNILAATDTAITGFQVFTNFTGAAQANFFIADHVTHEVLYNSGPIAFAQDSSMTAKSSPTLSFTLLAGRSYDIGLTAILAAGSTGIYTYANGDSGFTQGGLTGTTNASLFTTPPVAWIGTLSPADPYLVVFGPSAVPEPSSLALSGIAFAGMMVGVAARRRSSKAASAR